MNCWWFHFWNEIPINCLFTKWKCTYIYILDFESCRWSALNMGFVDKAAFKNARAMVFFEVGWSKQQFLVRFNFFLGAILVPIHLPLRAHRGEINVLHIEPPMIYIHTHACMHIYISTSISTRALPNSPHSNLQSQGMINIWIAIYK